MKILLVFGVSLIITTSVINESIRDKKCTILTRDVTLELP